MIASILNAIGKVWNSVWKVTGWLQRTWLTWLALLVSIVLTPIQWALNSGLFLLQQAIDKVNAIADSLYFLHVSDLGTYASQAGLFLSYADNFVPIGLVFKLVTGLFALWVTIQGVRVCLWVFRRIWDLIP